MLNLYARIEESVAVEVYNQPEGTDLPGFEKVPDEVREGYIWDGVAWTAPEEPLVSLEELRQYRDIRISECDWIVTRHRDQETQAETPALTDEAYKEWINYRRDLRDFPNTYEPVKIDQIPWPLEPYGDLYMYRQNHPNTI